MLPYQAVAMDYAVSSGFQRHQPPIGLGVNINPAFTHSWFVPADLCVPYKQTPLLEPGHVKLIISAYIILFARTMSISYIIPVTIQFFVGIQRTVTLPMADTGCRVSNVSPTGARVISATHDLTYDGHKPGPSAAASQQSGERISFTIIIRTWSICRFGKLNRTRNKARKDNANSGVSHFAKGFHTTLKKDIKTDDNTYGATVATSVVRSIYRRGDVGKVSSNPNWVFRFSLLKSDSSGMRYATALLSSPVAYCSILELRKEKSRDAARSRRGKENFEFYELAKNAPATSCHNFTIR
ncbi:hypothetical protein NQ317_009944 [Molorchus minor]|uniref:BHLH domain-containing protein n=1 Tax=Molorchus minor TaxID=1323400 RepID=A0ABQ9K6M1_9CUCU|nr:hypothetical protein NQ317_009944 [Molorchus minor]